jgi:hypothetical protein
VQNQSAKYLRILQLELDDLREDAKARMEACRQRKEAGQITDYTFKENTAFLGREINGIEHFLTLAARTDPDAFDSVDALMEHLHAVFTKQIKEYGIAKCVDTFIQRKLEKVRRYVEP